MEEIYISHDSEHNIAELLSKYLYNGEIQICLKYNSDFRSAKIIRDYIDELCTILKIDAMWRSRIILITDELNNNAIEYGSKKGDLNILRFESKKGGNKTTIKIEVEDSGNGEFHKDAGVMEILRKERISHGFNHHHSIRGRGLFMIISSIVDNLYFKDSERGGLIVGIEKTL